MFYKSLFSTSLFLALLSGPNIEAAKLLSSAKEIKSDVTIAAKSKADASSFWGVSYLVDPAGAKDQEPVSTDAAQKILGSYIKSSENFYNAAFLLHLKKNSELNSSLANSQDANLAALSVATMAMSAAISYHESLIERNNLNISENVEAVPEAKGSKKKKRGKKGKKGGKSSGESSPAVAIDEEVLLKFLNSNNTRAQFLAIQAAAYAKISSLKETINGLTLKSLESQAARLFYEARVDGQLNQKDLMTLAKVALKKRSSNSASAVSFSLDAPAMSFICQAIGETMDESLSAVLHQALNAPDLKVQVDAAKAIVKMKSPQSLSTVNSKIAKAPWPVLVHLCYYSAEVPNAKLLPALIQRLAKEKGRMRINLNYAISVITGGQHGAAYKDWLSWYKSNKAFKVDEQASADFRNKYMVQVMNEGPNGYFYSLPIYSDRFCYVVDTSASMRGPRIESLDENMAMSVEQLLNKSKYNIVDFGGDVEIMETRGLTDDLRKGGARVKAWDLSLGTRSFCAIRQSLLFPGIDSIYFLSDGAPARDSVKNWQGITEGVMMLTRYMPIAVHCIDFDPKAGNQAYMINLAKYNEGRHESIEVGPGAPDGGGKKKKKKK
ncbi:cardiolipin synthetase [Lentisphaera araneosa HTCC2155]|uniref:Cardiolipin synthetase n=1 Tax=Lentisphaera araneosa HTCC2155 TaxID=313628 RepID=A6DK65_9BACT|nr:hypothetical protein [Lentisphaera araneosa]EDM27763.1 cardiolipin synthetase [Lentisphaera araneosa HTCC2155]